MPLKINPDSGLLDLTSDGGGGGSGELSDLTGDSGGAVSPDGSDNISLLGDATQAFIQTTGTPASNKMEFKLVKPAIDGQLLIGHTANAEPSVSTLTPGAGITVTNAAGSITIASTATSALSMPTDAGKANSAAGEIDIRGGTGVSTAASGNTVTVTADADVPTSFDGDSGTAVPSGNSLEVFGGLGLESTGSGARLTMDMQIEAAVSNSTGIIQGGVLSVGAPNTTFSITDGNGCVVDSTTDPDNPTITSVSWTGLSNLAVTNIATHLISFIFINSSGSVIQQTGAPTNAQRRTLIELGVVVHVDKTIVDTVNNEQQTCIDPVPQLYDLMDGLGFFNVNGNVFTANGANLLLNKSAGTVLKSGSNWNVSTQNPHHESLASLSGLTFQYRFQDGSNGATGTAVDPDIYDVGGTSTVVPNNKYTIQRIFSFTSNNVKIQPGQTLYTSLADAKANIQIEAFTTEASIAANGLLRGFLVVRQGTSDLTNTNQVFFLEAGKFGGAAGSGGLSVTTLQGAYDNSVTPEITVDSTNGALTVQDASSPIGAALFEVTSNGGGTDYLSVTSSGADIDGALTITTDLAAAHGGTGRSSHTAYAVICGGTTSSAAQQSIASVGSAGQVLVSNGAGALPTFQANTGISWVVETGTSATMAVGTGTFANNAGLVTLTLPTTAAVGDIIEVAGMGSGGWKIAQNASEKTYFGTSTTTTGVGGSLASTQQYDTIKLVCQVANTEWIVLSSVGNITVV